MKLFPIAVLCAFPIAAHAENWEQVRHQCVVQVEQEHHCTTACVNRLWPLIARCANRDHEVDPSRLELCMMPIFSARYIKRTPELVGDPVAEAFACARR
jgi:hypothetical protein